MGGGAVCSGGGAAVRSVGLSLQLSRRVNVVLIVVAAAAAVVAAPDEAVVSAILCQRRRKNCATGRWAVGGAGAGTAALHSSSSRKKCREATKSGKFYGQQQQKLQYTIARTTTRTLLTWIGHGRWVLLSCGQRACGWIGPGQAGPGEVMRLLMFTALALPSH